MDSAQPSGIAETIQLPQDEWTIGDKMPQSKLKRFDPLDMLPEEIWIDIIADSASEMRPDAGIVISQDTLLDLMQVSLSWNIQISSSAVLWVDIILEDEYDAAAKATLAFHYSKQASLALYMYSPTDWWDTLWELIMANRSRITKLCIRNVPSIFDRLILRQLLPLSSLATLDCGEYLYRTPDFTLGYLLDSPITWTSLWLGRDISEWKTTGRLRVIRLNCELEDVFDLVKGSECLEEVLVYPASDLSDDKRTMNVTKSVLQDTPLPWKSLTYRSYRDSFLEATIPRLPKLVELRIQVSQQIFCSIMPLISHLENLSIFDVALHGEWDRLESVTIPQAFTKVQEAVINIYSDISMVMKPVVDTLFRCLPNIRHLTLVCRSFPTIRMLTAPTGFHHLQTLLLDAIMQQQDMWSNSDGVLDAFPTSVERVVYSIYGPVLNQLIPLQSHHIKYLEISSPTLSEVDIYSQRWKAMRTIVLTSYATVNWKGPTYQHLHTICLKALPLGSLGLGRRNETKMCRDFALHPEYFPALSKLELGACPELDILFILLETRNVTIRPGISPISTLVIPTRCPPFLVERLRELIKGIKESVSSYYNLSIAGNYDIITDPSITGCADCHRALRFCTRAAKLSHSLTPSPLMEYPESAAEILESWDARAENWYPFETTLRHGRCERSFSLVSISR